jgi:hypothetical protein
MIWKVLTTALLMLCFGVIAAGCLIVLLGKTAWYALWAPVVQRG